MQDDIFYYAVGYELMTVIILIFYLFLLEGKSK